MGSHTRPSMFASAMPAASRHMAGVPPMSSTAMLAAMALAEPTSAWQPPSAPATVALRAMICPTAAALTRPALSISSSSPNCSCR